MLWCTLSYCIYRQKAAGAENAIYFSCIVSVLHDIVHMTTIVILRGKKKKKFQSMENNTKKYEANMVFTHFMLPHFFMHLCYRAQTYTCKLNVNMYVYYRTWKSC